jgi:hypothetical protein
MSLASGLETSRARFERAFIAVSYLLGRRGAELSSPLHRPSAAAHALQIALGAPLREQCAAVLAAELARVATTLEARKLP